jgi:hypothetical protein
MPATVRSVATGIENDGTISVAQPAGAGDGDVLVAFCLGYATNLIDVTATGFTERDSVFDGSSRVGKVYTKVAASESWPKSFTNTPAYDYYAVILVAVQGADTTTNHGVDAVEVVNNATSDATPDAPTISPAGSDSLLLCAMGSFATSAAARTVTPPSGMTELADFQRPDQYDTYSAASLALVASGATGAKTFTVTSGGDLGYLAASIAIKSAAGGGGTSHTRTIMRTVATGT